MTAEHSNTDILTQLPDTSADALISGGLETFLVITCTVCGLIWLSEQKPLRRLFKMLPLVIWVVLVPAILVGTDILPKGLQLYLDIGKICLPLSLFYLIVSCDLSGISKLGKPAMLAAISGTISIAVGGIVVVLLFAVGENAHLWQGFAVISAGWIGGTANGVAVQQGIQAPASVIAPLILMQTLMGFIWLLAILSAAPHQKKISSMLGSVQLNNENHLEPTHTDTSQHTLKQLGGLLALGFVCLIVSGGLGQFLPELGNPTIVSAATWIILIISATGIYFSYFHKKRIPEAQSSNLGYLFLYMMLASLGTQLDFSAFNAIGTYAAAGAAWLLVHLLFMVVAGRIFKLPAAMLALGSMSNIGGIVTTPLVASYYDRKLVPVALLMAVGTQIIGVYLPFLLATLFSKIAV